MLSVARHYSDYHPDLLPNLKDILGLRVFLEYRCRVFVNKLMNYIPNQYDPKFIGNAKDVLTEMTFDYKTVKFVNDWAEGCYDKKFYSAISCIPYNILKNYIDLCGKYIENFKNLLNEINYICFDEYTDEKTLKNVTLENFAELDLYQMKHKEAFFFISLTDDVIQNNENFFKNLNSNIIENIDEDKEIKIKRNRSKFKRKNMNIISRKNNIDKFWNQIGDKNSLNNMKDILPYKNFNFFNNNDIIEKSNESILNDISTNKIMEIDELKEDNEFEELKRNKEFLNGDISNLNNDSNISKIKKGAFINKNNLYVRKIIKYQRRSNSVCLLNKNIYNNNCNIAINKENINNNNNICNTPKNNENISYNNHCNIAKNNENNNNNI